MNRLAVLSILALGLLTRTGFGQTTDPVQKAVTALYQDIRSETLPNGLRVFLKPIPGAPTVTTMMAYKVGSADEELDQTGLSHYLEHLMFKGTDKLMPGDIDRLTQRNGGRNNAYTAEDITNYHFDFAADRWTVALKIEADRMRNLRIDEKHEFEQEKKVVISELEGGEDEPWDKESKLILPLLFGPKAPYGHPVIGEAEHVLGATAPVIKAHYDKWYHPNNAALVIVGGFDPEEAMKLVREHFAAIPAGKLPPRKEYKPISRDGPVKKVIISKFEVPRLLMGFNSVAYGDPDEPVLEIITAILTHGKTGRLYRRLVEQEEVANEVSATHHAGRYPGFFQIQVELLKDEDIEATENLVLEELTKLATEDVQEAELRRVKRGLLADAVFNGEDTHSLADSIASAVTLGTLESLQQELPRLNAVTAADIKRVAAKYLAPQTRVSIYSDPKADAKGDPKPAKPAPPQRQSKRLYRAEAKPAGGAMSLANTRRVVLPNGLTVLLLENRRLPIIVADLLVQDVRLREPGKQAGVAALTGSMLDEGTTTRTGPQIAEEIADMGAVLSFSGGGGELKLLSPDKDKGLKLFFDCLLNPNFEEKAFERQKDQLLASIEDEEGQPQAQALREFNRLIYGKHPLGRPSSGTIEGIEPLKPEDCKKFHASVYVPNNTILALVGDFDSQEMLNQITELTKDWKKGELAPLALPELPIIRRLNPKIISSPNASQTYIYVGHAGIKRSNPDYYKLQIMDNVLGTGPGFTDRLSANLRDRQGLAYTVNASITSNAGLEPGTFTAYIGTANDKFEVAKNGLLKEIQRMVDEPPTDQEVEDAKLYLTGSLAFRLTTSEQVASQLLAIEAHGLGLDYLAKYRKAIEAVKVADVHEVAKKYLRPTELVIVAAGGIDKKGQALKKE